ncbi:MAG TPA: NADP-dependent oxidoreductase [Elusimicrobiota bacterium]|jgi:NADPH:quinone reductase-like Zn-dependent oxidoreductase|nr:NADP-dependent oxidoreductase [Elusimicrobiota bacterium]
MDTMRAVRVSHFGGPEALKILDVPRPRPRPGEALVRVEATGVNPVDWKLREGFFKDLPLPFTPGGDFCGTIEELGSGAEGYEKGDVVFGCADGSVGAEAEYLAVSVKNLALKPRTLGPVEAAGVPLAGMTAWQGLFTHGRLKFGETVLILGASGGVGSIAVQLAKSIGARVIGTASAECVERLKALGCDEPVDYKARRFEDAARGVDLCLDLLGGDFQQRAFATLKRGGRLLSAVEPPDAALARRRGISAEFFRMKPDAAELRELALKIDSGELKVPVAKVLPLERAAEAEELNRRHEVHGKIVLRVGARPS